MLVVLPGFASMPTITGAAIENIVTEPEDLANGSQHFLIGQHSFNLAFHVGQT